MNRFANHPAYKQGFEDGSDPDFEVNIIRDQKSDETSEEYDAYLNGFYDGEDFKNGRDD